MPKDAASWPTPVNAGDTPIYPADVTIALQAELAALADIDAHYEEAVSTGELGWLAEDEGAIAAAGGSLSQAGS
jgi:hypothetical protein